MRGFTAEERKALARALRDGTPLECPACGAALSRQDVPPSTQVSYVRRRAWLLCPSCGRTGAVDRPRRGAGEGGGGGGDNGGGGGVSWDGPP